MVHEIPKTTFKDCVLYKTFEICAIKTGGAKGKYKEISKQSVKTKENEGIFITKKRQNLEILPNFCFFANQGGKERENFSGRGKCIRTFVP